MYDIVDLMSAYRSGLNSKVQPGTCSPPGKRLQHSISFNFVRLFFSQTSFKRGQEGTISYV